MRQYKLRCVLHQPSEETEGMFMVEAADLPGCRAWGETQEEAYRHLESVAAEFIASYQEHGDALPEGVEEIGAEELVVAV